MKRFDSQRNNQGRRRMNSRTSMAQREDRIRKTVYVSDIDQQVSERFAACLSDVVLFNCARVSV